MGSVASMTFSPASGGSIRTTSGWSVAAQAETDRRRGRLSDPAQAGTAASRARSHVAKEDVGRRRSDGRAFVRRVGRSANRHQAVSRDLAPVVSLSQRVSAPLIVAEWLAGGGSSASTRCPWDAASERRSRRIYAPLANGRQGKRPRDDTSAGR